MIKIFGRIEREVHNWTNRWSNSCHSREVSSVRTEGSLYKEIVIC